MKHEKRPLSKQLGITYRQGKRCFLDGNLRSVPVRKKKLNILPGLRSVEQVLSASIALSEIKTLRIQIMAPVGTGIRKQSRIYSSNNFLLRRYEAILGFWRSEATQVVECADKEALVARGLCCGVSSGAR